MFQLTGILALSLDFLTFNFCRASCASDCFDIARSFSSRIFQNKENLSQKKFFLDFSRSFFSFFAFLTHVRQKMLTFQAQVSSRWLSLTKSRQCQFATLKSDIPKHRDIRKLYKCFRLRFTLGLVLVHCCSRRDSKRGALLSQPSTKSRRGTGNRNTSRTRWQTMRFVCVQNWKAAIG